MINHEDDRLMSTKQAMLEYRKLADDLEWAGYEAVAYRKQEREYEAMFKQGILYIPRF